MIRDFGVTDRDARHSCGNTGGGDPRLDTRADKYRGVDHDVGRYLGRGALAEVDVVTQTVVGTEPGDPTLGHVRPEKRFKHRVDCGAVNKSPVVDIREVERVGARRESPVLATIDLQSVDTHPGLVGTRRSDNRHRVVVQRPGGLDRRPASEDDRPSREVDRPSHLVGECRKKTDLPGARRRPRVQIGGVVS